MKKIYRYQSLHANEKYINKNVKKKNNDIKQNMEATVWRKTDHLRLTSFEQSLYTKLMAWFPKYERHYRVSGHIQISVQGRLGTIITWKSASYRIRSYSGSVFQLFLVDAFSEFRSKYSVSFTGVLIYVRWLCWVPFRRGTRKRVCSRFCDRENKVVFIFR